MKRWEDATPLRPTAFPTPEIGTPRASARLRSAPTQGRAAPARSIRCRRLPTTARPRASGCSSTSPTAASRRSPNRGKPLLRRIARADSVGLDPYRWLFQPYEAGALLVKDARTLEHAFEVHHDILQEPRGRSAWARQPSTRCCARGPRRQPAGTAPAPIGGSARCSSGASPSTATDSVLGRPPRVSSGRRIGSTGRAMARHGAQAALMTHGPAGRPPPPPSSFHPPR